MSRVEGGSRTVLRQVPEERPADAPLLGELALAVLETLPDPCLVADRAGNIIYANPACACLCHRTPEEFVGTNVFGYVPTESLAQALKTGAPVRGKRQKLYGGPREVLVDAYPLFYEGQVKGAVSFLREVGRAPDSAGERETMEKDVACLEARLAFLEKSAPAPVFFVGQNRAMREAVAAVRRAAAGGRPLLLKGEAGSGKTLLAQTLNELGRRTKGPLVFLACTSLLPETAEAELLHAFSLAGEGTVVLEEVGRLGPILQSRLCSFMDRGDALALVIATTREDLEGQAARGAFLPDLYRFFRETVILLPLRDYREDLPGLVAHLLERFSRETGKKVAGVSAETLALFFGYSWPGNVRELANVLERAVILAEEGKLITPQQVFLPRKEWEEEGEILPLKEARRLMVARALARYGRTVEGKKKAARALGISLVTLYHYLHRMPGLPSGAPYCRSRAKAGG